MTRRRNPEPTVEVYRDRHGDIADVTVRLAGGSVSAIRSRFDKPDVMHVGWSELPESARGKGLGVQMYAALMDWALANNITITSDEALSPAAGRVWEALAKRGYPIQKHPTARLYTEDDRSAWGADDRNKPFLLHRRNPRSGYTSADRTDPDLWEAVKREVTAGSKGGKPGQWSARKAQLAVALYRQRGGGYWGPKDPRNALAKWTREKWRTKSGRPSLETGERYLPSKAIAALTDAEYAATTRAKRAGMRKGQQFVPQPEDVALKVRAYRRNPTPPESLVEDYSYGRCMWLALALHQRYGWPITAEIAVLPSGERYVSHAWVTMSDGREVDILGPQTRVDRFGGREMRVSPREMLNIVGETSDIPRAEVAAEVAAANEVVDRYLVSELGRANPAHRASDKRYRRNPDIDPRLLAADGARYFSDEALAEADQEAGSSKSRTALVLMRPRDFLAMAEPGMREESQAALERVLDAGVRLSDVPRLFIATSRTDPHRAVVTGHEGRHRSRALLARGVTQMPVRIHSQDIRWGEQTDPESWDYDPVLPSVLVGEGANRHNTLPMPVPLHYPELAPRLRRSLANPRRKR